MAILSSALWKKRPPADSQGRSCGPDLDDGWTAPPPAAP